MEITGTIINYYIHCKRQCYLFSHKINLENNSELVFIGKEYHKQKAKGDKKAEISLEHIKIDKITDKYIIERKKSDSDIKAATMQLKYYMYLLNKKGIKRDGKIEIIEKNKNYNEIIIPYSNDIDVEIEKLLEEIKFFLENDIPKETFSKVCKKCAYFDYCFI